MSGSSRVGSPFQEPRVKNAETAKTMPRGSKAVSISLSGPFRHWPLAGFGDGDADRDGTDMRVGISSSIQRRGRRRRPTEGKNTVAKFFKKRLKWEKASERFIESVKEPSVNLFMSKFFTVFVRRPSLAFPVKQRAKSLQLLFGKAEERWPQRTEPFDTHVPCCSSDPIVFEGDGDHLFPGRGTGEKRPSPLYRRRKTPPAPNRLRVRAAVEKSVSRLHRALDTGCLR